MSIKDFNDKENSFFSFESGTAEDTMSDILRTIHLNASSYFCINIAAPWGIIEPETDHGTFHVVVNGSAWVEAPNQDELIHLTAGDIIAFPSGMSHKIGNGNCKSFISSKEILKHIRNGENPYFKGHDITTLICGYFQYEKFTSLPLLRDMPAMLHIQSEKEMELNWLNQLIKTLANESRSLQPGGSIVINRLTEVLVIQLLRWHINHQKLDKGYFKALSYPDLSRSLQLIHNHFGRMWTVGELASAVGKSRTVFAKKFKQVVGMTPMAYLTQWRIKKAHQLLLERTHPVIDIAIQVGYNSEASFGKAFKKAIGQSPGQVRKNQSTKYSNQPGNST